MSYVGDLNKGAVMRVAFTTVNTSGVPTTLSGTPAIGVYEDGGTTEITSGVTLTVDFDSRTGLNMLTVDTSQSDYEVGKNYTCVITTGTVGGNSVVGYVVGQFSIENRLGIVDALLKRSVSNVEGSAPEHSITGAILFLLEWAISGTTLTVKRTDGTTTQFTKTLSTAASGDIVTGVS
jgi:hypothetical protein